MKDKGSHRESIPEEEGVAGVAPQSEAEREFKRLLHKQLDTDMKGELRTVAFRPAGHENSQAQQVQGLNSRESFVTAFGAGQREAQLRDCGLSDIQIRMQLQLESTANHGGSQDADPKRRKMSADPSYLAFAHEEIQRVLSQSKVPECDSQDMSSAGLSRHLQEIEASLLLNGGGSKKHLAHLTLCPSVLRSVTTIDPLTSRVLDASGVPISFDEPPRPQPLETKRPDSPEQPCVQSFAGRVMKGSTRRAKRQQLDKDKDVDETCKGRRVQGPQLPDQHENAPAAEPDSAGGNSKGLGHIVALSEAEVAAGVLSKEEMAAHPKFSQYSPGTPSKTLCLRNLASSVREPHLVALFLRFQGTQLLTFRLMQVGRMKGTAFVGFPDVEVATTALEQTNGFVLEEKPLVVQFAREAASGHQRAGAV
mmetsp:Transcript_34518/g.78724  ORF Transcript_34518/g.78724 Transcript_34518/m.78724 type:complete len:422 (-) Transcript_34518:610-1875(-)